MEKGEGEGKGMGGKRKGRDLHALPGRGFQNIPQAPGSSAALGFTSPGSGG